MSMAKPKEPKLTELEIPPLEKEQPKEVSRLVHLSDYDDLTRLKLLLLQIKRKAEAHDVNIIYKAIENKSVMHIYLYENDLLVTMTKPMTVSNVNDGMPDYVERVVTVFISRISRYGNTYYLKFKDEEIQLFVKDLFYILINEYYDNLSRLDKEMDLKLSREKRSSLDMIRVLIEKQLELDFLPENYVEDELKNFDIKKSKPHTKSNNRKHPLFF